MATVTKTPLRRQDLAESHRRVQHPLQRLRGYIRSYVAAEGLVVLFLYLALWFWIGLVLDYGCFRLFGFDWVQIWPFNAMSVRGALLGVLVLGLVIAIATKVLFRLFREFRDRALALVLERRFPAQLGDRLITAVELANVKAATRFGYSLLMIEQTIHDAAERVEVLPVKQVFNWRRLRRQYAFVALFTVGVYSVVVGALCLIAALRGESRPFLLALHRFHDVAAIWFERNVLLHAVIWPRSAYLVVLVPEAEETRIGRDAPAQLIRVRALKWVIADSKAKEGWRALIWNDLTPELLGGPVPSIEILPRWQPRSPQENLSDSRLALTLDEIEMHMDKPTSSAIPLTDSQLALQTNRIAQAVGRQAAAFSQASLGAVMQVVTAVGAEESPGSGQTLPALKELFTRLEARAAEPAMSRRLRMLKIPEIVQVRYYGSTTRNDMTLHQEGHDFTGQLTELRESVRFVVSGEDYTTSERSIIVVAPPALVSLTRDEYQPAYLYYRVPRDGNVEVLRGMKQLFADIPVSLFGEKTIRVPFGTDVVLKGKIDKQLKPNGVRILPQPKGTVPVIASPVMTSDHDFILTLKNLRTARDFTFEFTDTDNVTSLRQVIIKPEEDAAPEADEVVVQGIRKTNQGYMCTVDAIIPFAGTVRDDHALDKVEFVYSLDRLDTQTEQNRRDMQLIGAFLLLTGGPGHDLLAAATVAPLAHKPKPGATAQQPAGPKRVMVPAFATAMQKRSAEPLTKAQLLPLLQQSFTKQKPPRLPLLNLFTFNPVTFDPDDTDSGFDVQKLRLKTDESVDLQPRYRMQLWVEATDNNILTGPRTNQVKERFNFLVVSEAELLVEIAKDEEVQHVKLEKTVGLLRETEARLGKLNQDLAMNPTTQRVSVMVLEVQQFEQAVEKCLSATTEVRDDYTRLFREMQLNRVDPESIKKVKGSVIEPLTSILDKDFEQTRIALVELETVLGSEEPTLKNKLDAAKSAGAKARKQLMSLIERLDRVMASMEKITTKLDLVRRLQKILGEQQRQAEFMERLWKEEYDRIVKELENEADDTPPQKRP